MTSCRCWSQSRDDGRRGVTRVFSAGTPRCNEQPNRQRCQPERIEAGHLRADRFGQQREVVGEEQELLGDPPIDLSKLDLVEARQPRVDYAEELLRAEADQPSADRILPISIHNDPELGARRVGIEVAACTPQRTRARLASNRDAIVVETVGWGQLDIALAHGAQRVRKIRTGTLVNHCIRAYLLGEKLREDAPQDDFLSLLNLGDGTAIGAKRGMALDGRTWLKDRIDGSFMEKYQ